LGPAPLIDRDITAQVLGLMVERTWKRSHPLIKGARAERDDWVYAEWEMMQDDTFKRRMDQRHKSLRKRTCQEHLAE
jgi:hypothetical protein